MTLLQIFFWKRTLFYLKLSLQIFRVMILLLNTYCQLSPSNYDEEVPLSTCHLSSLQGSAFYIIIWAIIGYSYICIYICICFCICFCVCICESSTDKPPSSIIITMSSSCKFISVNCNLHSCLRYLGHSFCQLFSA